jgi:3-oxoacyl-[acyl-carrier-protein] synthase II
LLDGHCGISNVTRRDARFAELPCQIAAVVPAGLRAEGGWTAEEWLSRSVSIDYSFWDLFFLLFYFI